jgi:excinuclease ABC subunit A
MSTKKINEFVNKIIIKGARVHNLKDVHLELPKNQLIVFSGLSGSGKSSLAFDTIFAEGQRRYIESLSPYARQFLGQMEKPDVDEITGLSPAIAIDQKAHSHNPRSTVATLTEIYDYMRVLFARAGVAHCPTCNRAIRKMSVEEIVDTIRDIAARGEPQAKSRTEPAGSSSGNTIRDEAAKRKADHVTILASMVRGRKGEYFQLLQDLFRDGFGEARIWSRPRSCRGSKARKSDVRKRRISRRTLRKSAIRSLRKRRSGKLELLDRDGI